MHETYDHTADLGLRARTTDLNSLFAEMAQALTSALVEDPETIRPEVCVTVRLPNDDREFLLFDWLKDLLRRFEADRMVFRRFEVKLSDAGLEGNAWGEPIDEARHELAHEVKAITYHELKVEQTGEEWLAEVIVDI